MTVTTDNNTPTTTTNLLTLLDQYSTLHTTASTNFKSSLWNITKARRGRGYQSSGLGPLGSSEYSVESVREELEATALIEVITGNNGEEEEEPELVDEHDDDNNNNAVTKIKGNCNSSDMNMVLHFDGMEGAKCNIAATVDNAAITDKNHIQDANNPEGLRRRRNKGGNNDDESTSKWTTEEDQLEETQNDLIKPSDPLQLFGVPPPALRVAQSHSRDALAYYVEVANLAREIMRIVQEE